MRQTINDHILFLDRKILELSGLLTDSALLPTERDQIVRQIELANTAVGHYRRGIALEERVRGNVISMPLSIERQWPAA